MDGITTSINVILKSLIKDFNTFLDCPVRFSGEYSEQKIHSFIEYIEHYKRVKCITDEQALQELQYLLLGQAHDWWLRRKKSLDTWSEALIILENQYSKNRPANVIYTQILEHRYEDYECEDDFIDDKIELLNELSQPELKESNKLEIIFALLPSDLKNKVKMANITSAKELKEQLRLAKLDGIQSSINEENTISKNETKAEQDVVSTDVENINVSSMETNCQEENINITDISDLSEIETNIEPERDPVIKVRRTEDLMPQDMKEETNKLERKELLQNNTETTTNNHANFQIDADIMSQINNIIDESEKNMSAINANKQVTPTILSQPSNGVVPLEFLGFQTAAAGQSKTSSNEGSKSSSQTKVRKRCSFCRHGNHTTQACHKRAKLMKLHTDKFPATKANEKNNCKGKNNVEPMPPLPSSISNNNTIANAQPIEMSSESQSNFSNPIPTISTFTDTTSAVLSSTVILNNITEKSVNSMLTTKLIAPINGKTSNKNLAAKLRCTNTPTPKCHQCGALGFYKSICPNCSPIYNSNSNNQYNK